jgi:hypothetical protein
MRRSLPSCLVCLALVACGGQTASPGTPAPDDGGGAIADGPGGADGPTLHTHFLTSLQGSGGGCLPMALLPDAQGLVACTVFELPAGGGTCDASPGLWPVDAGTAATVRSRAQAPASQAVCALAQLPESAWVAGSCAASASAGWCYVAGAAAGGQCPQALRFSPSGTPAAGAVLLLGC